MDCDAFQFQHRVVVDVIEVQYREHAGIRARSAHSLFGLGAVQVVAEKFGRDSPGPLVEVAEHDSRS